MKSSPCRETNLNLPGNAANDKAASGPTDGLADNEACMEAGSSVTERIPAGIGGHHRADFVTTGERNGSSVRTSNKRDKKAHEATVDQTHGKETSSGLLMVRPDRGG
jgi:hypothetical protein